ncbi:MAG: hypothetical protein BGO63_03645 [Candidatus Accumulibacter sp. 66-26]|nr:MAG: hypothetical protein BGO63_03645 [Candidatus Accumulibacter sp. 66-26]
MRYQLKRLRYGYFDPKSAANCCAKTLGTLLQLLTSVRLSHAYHSKIAPRHRSRGLGVLILDAWQLSNRPDCVFSHIHHTLTGENDRLWATFLHIDEDSKNPHGYASFKQQSPLMESARHEIGFRPLGAKPF